MSDFVFTNLVELPESVTKVALEECLTSKSVIAKPLLSFLSVKENSDVSEFIKALEENSNDTIEDSVNISLSIDRHESTIFELPEVETHPIVISALHQLDFDQHLILVNNCIDFVLNTKNKIETDDGIINKDILPECHRMGLMLLEQALLNINLAVEGVEVSVNDEDLIENISFMFKKIIILVNKYPNVFYDTAFANSLLKGLSEIGKVLNEVNDFDMNVLYDLIANILNFVDPGSQLKLMIKFNIHLPKWEVPERFEMVTGNENVEKNMSSIFKVNVNEKIVKIGNTERTIKEMIGNYDNKGTIEIVNTVHFEHRLGLLINKKQLYVFDCKFNLVKKYIFDEDICSENVTLWFDRIVNGRVIKSISSNYIHEILLNDGNRIPVPPLPPLSDIDIMEDRVIKDEYYDLTIEMLQHFEFIKRLNSRSIDEFINSNNQEEFTISEHFLLAIFFYMLPECELDNEKVIGFLNACFKDLKYDNGSKDNTTLRTIIEILRSQVLRKNKLTTAIKDYMLNTFNTKLTDKLPLWVLVELIPLTTKFNHYSLVLINQELKHYVANNLTNNIIETLSQVPQVFELLIQVVPVHMIDLFIPVLNEPMLFALLQRIEQSNEIIKLSEDFKGALANLLNEEFFIKDAKEYVSFYPLITHMMAQSSELRNSWTYKNYKGDKLFSNELFVEGQEIDIKKIKFDSKLTGDELKQPIKFTFTFDTQSIDVSITDNEITQLYVPLTIDNKQLKLSSVYIGEHKISSMPIQTCRMEDNPNTFHKKYVEFSTSNSAIISLFEMNRRRMFKLNLYIRLLCCNVCDEADELSFITLMNDFEFQPNNLAHLFTISGYLKNLLENNYVSAISLQFLIEIFEKISYSTVFNSQIALNLMTTVINDQEAVKISKNTLKMSVLGHCIEYFKKFDDDQQYIIDEIQKKVEILRNSLREALSHTKIHDLTNMLPEHRFTEDEEHFLAQSSLDDFMYPDDDLRMVLQMAIDDGAGTDQYEAARQMMDSMDNYTRYESLLQRKRDRDAYLAQLNQQSADTLKQGLFSILDEEFGVMFAGGKSFSSSLNFNKICMMFSKLYHEPTSSKLLDLMPKIVFYLQILKQIIDEPGSISRASLDVDIFFKTFDIIHLMMIGTPHLQLLIFEVLQSLFTNYLNPGTFSVFKDLVFILLVIKYEPQSLDLQNLIKLTDVDSDILSCNYLCFVSYIDSLIEIVNQKTNNNFVQFYTEDIVLSFKDVDEKFGITYARLALMDMNGAKEAIVKFVNENTAKAMEIINYNKVSEKNSVKFALEREAILKYIFSPENPLQGFIFSEDFKTSFKLPNLNDFTDLLDIICSLNEFENNQKLVNAHLFADCATTTINSFSNTQYASKVIDMSFSAFEANADDHDEDDDDDDVAIGSMLNNIMNTNPNQVVKIVPPTILPMMPFLNYNDIRISLAAMINPSIVFGGVMTDVKPIVPFNTQNVNYDVRCAGTEYNMTAKERSKKYVPIRELFDAELRLLEERGGLNARLLYASKWSQFRNTNSYEVEHRVYSRKNKKNVIMTSFKAETANIKNLKWVSQPSLPIIAGRKSIAKLYNKMNILKSWYNVAACVLRGVGVCFDIASQLNVYNTVENQNNLLQWYYLPLFINSFCYSIENSTEFSFPTFDDDISTFITLLKTLDLYKLSFNAGDSIDSNDFPNFPKLFSLIPNNQINSETEDVFAIIANKGVTFVDAEGYFKISLNDEKDLLIVAGLYKPNGNSVEDIETAIVYKLNTVDFSMFKELFYSYTYEAISTLLKE
eukprot:TRINITY_DN3101_c1_g2_i2.p1 TRINITY_DN3101_c1_g2~~TRINITY_DN3101_c1_g2_i2.p1  ORF type:complete len:1783 (+),score=502.86 TRINITY_DN3101_c1_g2_i2:41-5350(+)